MRIVDEQGREVRFGTVNRRLSSGRLEAGLELFPDSRSLDITVAVHQGRLAEFLVRPDWDTSRWAAVSSAFSHPPEKVTKGAR